MSVTPEEDRVVKDGIDEYVVVFILVIRKKMFKTSESCFQNIFSFTWSFLMLSNPLIIRLFPYLGYDESVILHDKILGGKSVVVILHFFILM